jgi:NTE family protein
MTANLALVLAGGGALGAYEAGVLEYALGELGGAGRFNIFCGTSAGALNVCHLAQRCGEPALGARQLADYWRSLTPEQVLRVSRRELAMLVRLATARRASLASEPRPPGAAHPPVPGLFNTDPLREQMQAQISREQIRRGFESGALRGVALCATEVCTGRSVIFYETSAGVEYLPGRDPTKVARRVEIGVEHAMASASMPFLFATAQINGICYTDGAIRQNTPLNPALRMGADRVLVVSVTPDPAVEARRARAGCRRNPYPGSLFLLGKMVNVLLSQSLDYELNRIEMYNRLIRGGTELYGEGFLAGLNEILSGQRNSIYRPVATCHIRPSRNLHQLALEALRAAPRELRLPGPAGRLVSWLLGSDLVAESELLSYLMFTPTFIRALIELGRADARAQRESLSRFFAG